MQEAIDWLNSLSDGFEKALPNKDTGLYEMTIDLVRQLAKEAKEQALILATISRICDTHTPV